MNWILSLEIRWLCWVWSVSIQSPMIIPNLFGCFYNSTLSLLQRQQITSNFILYSFIIFFMTKGNWEILHNEPKCPCINIVKQGCYCSLSRVWLSVTPWTAACQASLSFIISLSLLKLLSIKSVMPSNHFILSPPSLFALTLSQPQGLFQWVSS